MSDLLSQDQIDDLFGADGSFQADVVEEAAPDPTAEVQVYDLDLFLLDKKVIPKGLAVCEQNAAYRLEPMNGI